MSYELYRADLIESLLEILEPDQLAAVMATVDRCSQKYEITRKTTALAVIDDISEALKMYIASLSIENLANGTIYNY